jgi:hypothetical protein
LHWGRAFILCSRASAKSFPGRFHVQPHCQPVQRFFLFVSASKDAIPKPSELEQENLRKLVGNFNQGPASHAGCQSASRQAQTEAEQKDLRAKAPPTYARATTRRWPVRAAFSR